MMDTAPSVPLVPVDTVGAFVGPPAVLAVGSGSGPLAGVSLAVKDVFDIEGLVTGAGNPCYAADHDVATLHAAAVQALLAAGVTVVAKTITDELAYSLSGTNTHFGTPVNVAAPGRIPGGSSAGSAAAVAAGLVDLALGTDTAGSVRIPASYCGIVGFRPTHGAISSAGVVPLAPSFDTVGLFARDIDLLVAAAVVLLGSPMPQPVAADGPPRLVMIAEVLDDVADDVADEVRRVASLLSGGAPVPVVPLGVDLVQSMNAFRVRQGWEAWQAHGAWITAQQGSGGPRFGNGIAARFDAASLVTAAQAAATDDVRAAVRAAVIAATADGSILVMPAAVGGAPMANADDPAAHDAQRMGTLRLTCIAGLAGAPVVVLPLGTVGTAGSRLPLGIALVGSPGGDHRLLRKAAQLMNQAGGHRSSGRTSASIAVVAAVRSSER